MMQEAFVGVDVAKNWLDIHHPRRGARRIANTPAAVRAFAAASARESAWVIFEASGGYDASCGKLWRRQRSASVE